MSERQITLKIQPEYRESRQLTQLQATLRDADKSAKTLATDIESISGKAPRDATNSINALDAAAAHAHSSVGQLSGGLGGVGDQLRGLSGQLSGLTQLAGAFGLAIGVQSAVSGLVALGESYTNLGNRINQVAHSEAERNALMSKTHDIADRVRGDWASTGELFVRLSGATREMGLSQTHVLRLTETLGKAFAMSGASSSEASAGMLQLSQAFASGRLQGDEFRSLAESMPSLLDIIAQRMGVARGELKQLAGEGRITSQVLVEAFDAAQGGIDRGFSKSMPTLSQSVTTFKNDMEATFGPLLQQLIPKLGSMLTSIGQTIGAIVDRMNGLAANSPLDKIGGSGMTKNVLTGGLVGRLEDISGLETGENILTAIDTGMNARDRAAGWDAIIDKQTQSLELSKLIRDETQKFIDLTGGRAGGGSMLDIFKPEADDYHKLDNFAAQLEALIDKGKQLADPNLGQQITLMWGKTANSLVKYGQDIIGVFGGIANSATKLLGGNNKLNTGLSEMEQYLRRLNAPLLDYEKHGPMVEALYRRGAISASTYAKELERMAAAAAAFNGAAKPRVDVLPGGRMVLYETPTGTPPSPGPNSVTGELPATDPNVALTNNEAITKRLDGISHGKQLTADWTRELADHQAGVEHVNEAYEKWLKTAEGGVNRVDRAWRDLNQGAIQDLRSGVLSLGDMLADAFAKGEISGKKMVQSLLADFARMTMRRFLTFGMDALGFGAPLPGHARGAYYPPGGGGGTDTQVMAFRKSPSEAVHVNTPDQEAVYQAAMRGGGQNNGPQHITVMMQGQNEVVTPEYIIRVVNERMPHLTSGLTGRPR